MLASRGLHADGRRESEPARGASSTHLSKRFIGKLPITQLTEDEAILHALNRLGYGPRPGDIERVRQMGLAKWIDRQLRPDSIDDSALDERLTKYRTLSLSPAELLDRFPPPDVAAKRAGETLQQYNEEMAAKRREAALSMQGGNSQDGGMAGQILAGIQGPNRIVAELSMAKMDRAIYSERQLEAVMEDFWFNHFNVFAGKAADRWVLTSYVNDTIRPRTLGKFQDLLLATAHSPAMLMYLDNWLSVDPAAFQQWRQDMELRQARARADFGFGAFPRPTAGFAARKAQERGLNENYGREVMELHTLGVNAGYTQQDVIEMAKCLTGWSIREPRRNPSFVFHPEFHAQGRKVVMGRTFRDGGESDGEEALRMLANDPHTARFISLALARHFVADNPPPALVARMAEQYRATRGDIRSVLRVMIYSPEFWSREAYRAKVKTPFELIASAARTLGSDVNLSLPLAQWPARLGEPLFLCVPPTGYSDQAEAWVNTGALLNRMNFALALATNHVPGASVNLGELFGEKAATAPDAALARSLELFLGSQASEQTRDALAARLPNPQLVQARLDEPRVNEALLSGLVLGSPEFQRR